MHQIAQPHVIGLWLHRESQGYKDSRPAPTQQQVPVPIGCAVPLQNQLSTGVAFPV